MENLLKIKNLSKRYHDLSGEVVAIKDINLEIKKGEFVAIVGPSGCGKSTLLSILSGLDTTSGGTIEFSNQQPRIGYMLQKDSLFPWRTILDNCLIGLEIHHEKTKETVDRITALLKSYGLEDFIHKYPSSLSGGMRQRVSLIRTLAVNPDILLLDEPFSALDYQTRLAVSDDVYEMIKHFGTTTIMVTHDLGEAISMADRVIVLSNRPSQVKNIYSIEFKHRTTPIKNRHEKEFMEYYEKIWKDLDIHVQ